VAPVTFFELGADVCVINNEPDGVNINKDCGSTHIEQLQKFVIESGADVGLAFDGMLTGFLRLTRTATWLTVTKSWP